MRSDQCLNSERCSVPLAYGTRIAACIAVFGWPDMRLAANDGDIGATATGSSRITLIMPRRARVTGIKDITFGPYDGTDLTGTSPVCISRRGHGSYGISLSSENGGFVLASSTQSATLRYRVAWEDRPIPYDKPGIAFFADNRKRAACTPVADRLRITVPAEDVDIAPPGVYSDALQILVMPL